MSEAVKAKKTDDAVTMALKALSDRMPWPVAKDTLHSLGLHVSTGWQTSISKIGMLDAESENFKKLAARLAEIYKQHTLVGEKMIQWYSLTGIPKETEKSFYSAVESAPKNIDIENTKYRDMYPFPVRDVELLKELGEIGPKLAAVFNQDNKTVFHYSSVRSYRDRIELNPDSFSEEDKRRLQQYEEIYAVLPIHRQCDDLIVFNHDSRLVEIRVDAPLGISADDVDMAMKAIAGEFNKLSTKNFGYAPFGSGAISFYSAIDPMYRNSSEGKVYELGFVATAKTSTSNNQGKLVRGRNRDLRDDAFHVGGSNAVTEITPYRIGIEWQGGGLDGCPQLIIPGTMRMLNKSPITVSEAFVRHCASEKDFSFVTNQLRSYIFRNK